MKEATEKSRANAAQTAVSLPDKHIITLLCNSPDNNRGKKAKHTAKHTMGEIKYQVSQTLTIIIVVVNSLQQKYVFLSVKCLEHDPSV